MKKAKIVIGSNFGDEGKGLMTDYFANKVNRNNESCLVVCHNGGSQKGHTVVTPSGLRHVFHHFGSGCFTNADTYLSSEYIVNPIIFNKEFSELYRKEAITKCFMSKYSRLTTPFDMMINQIAEENRGTNKHGSCGLGIFETILRDKEFNITAYKFNQLPDYTKSLVLTEIADKYVSNRLKQLEIKSLPTKWVEILSHKHEIIDNYINDFNLMMKNISICNDSILKDYDCVIFEGAQGLLLDQNNKDYIPNLTPSNTGLDNPIKIIDNKNCDIEVCYVTRTYITRHGAGRLDFECKKSEIGDNIVDLTNIPNPYQGTIRYGKLDMNLLLRTIKNDLHIIPENLKYKTSLAITHVNECGSKVICINGKLNINEFVAKINLDFDNLYLSSGMTRNQIRRT